LFPDTKEYPVLQVKAVSKAQEQSLGLVPVQAAQILAVPIMA